MFETIEALLRCTIEKLKRREKSDTRGRQTKGGYEREKLLCENTELLSTDVSVPDVYVKGTKQ